MINFDVQGAGRNMPSPLRRERRSFTLRGATDSVSASWAAQCAAAELDICRSRDDIVALKTLTSDFFDEKRLLCNDLKQLLITVREATTICRVVQSLETRAPQLAPHSDMSPGSDTESEARINVSISPRPSEISKPQRAREVSASPGERIHPYHHMLQSIVPSVAYASPQPRLPRPREADAVVQFESNAPDLAEDDLVVLLLKRQLQRRELELKQLMNQ